MNNKKKVVIVGDGNVGSSIAYGLCLKGSCEEVAIVDINEVKTKADVSDLHHGQLYCPIGHECKAKVGDYKDCKDASVIILTASVSMKNLVDRNELLGGNMVLYKSILDQIQENINDWCKIVVVANPCDSLALFVYEYLKIDASRVLATGCALDSARLAYRISDFIHCDTQKVEAYVIGEHGDSSVSCFSASKADGKKVDEIEGFNERVKSCIEQLVRNDGYEVNKLKGCTQYGVAMATIRIVEALLSDHNDVICISAYDSKEKVFFSYPRLVSTNGVGEKCTISIDDLSDDERGALSKSIDFLKMKSQEVLRYVEHVSSSGK